MGQDIAELDFSEQAYQRFQEKLASNLKALYKMLATPGFGVGQTSLGAELEMYIVDKNGHVLFVNEQIRQDVNDAQLTLELNRYNLEYNFTPHLIEEQPFFTMEREILEQLKRLNKFAAHYGGRVVSIGILPTLRKADFGEISMTKRERYRALREQLITRRGSHFQIDINGRQPLRMEMSDVTLEGASTSFQVHYRVAPNIYNDLYNAMQAITPLVLAIGANSPLLLGHSLWHETRIPLFKQSTDTRCHRDPYQWQEPPRVHFGNGWIVDGVGQLFAESVNLYDSLLPYCDDQDPIAELRRGGIPRLSELRMQQSTVWLWNRPVYDHSAGGHTRIEMRALPAGPTAIDMVANSVLMIGLAEGLKPNIRSLLPAIPFNFAEYNFYRSAQFGLGANIVWPVAGQLGCRERPLPEVLAELLPVARQGLQRIGVADKEITRYLSVIEHRLENGQTGAVWQNKMLAALEKANSRKEALHQLLEYYIKHSKTNTPVAEWPVQP